MKPAFRKLNLTLHVISSVGWLGSVASFLVLSIVGMLSQDADTVRGAYLVMKLLGQFLIVPLGLLALLTGILQSLGTQWGLFRYYWVVSKLALTIGATALLLLHQFTAVAEAALRVSQSAHGTLPSVGRLGTQLIFDAGFALLVLLAMTVLSIYKPWGKTRYGKYKQHEEREETLTRAGMLAELKIVGVAVALLVGLLVIVHMSGLAGGQRLRL